MNEQEAMDKAINDVLKKSLAELVNGGSPLEVVSKDALQSIYAAGAKAVEDKGGYRAGFYAGLNVVKYPPPGHILDDAGNVRKVLGRLPLTADGMVAGVGCELWADFNAVGMNAPLQCLGPGMPCVPMSRLYGSREAAEAARKER